MASTFVRGNRIWFRVKDRAGVWKSVPSGFNVGQEAQAEKALRVVEEQLAAEAAIAPDDAGPMTVRKYGTRWLEARKSEVESWENDESRLRLYVLPHLGDELMRDVRPRHIRDLFKKLRQRLTKRRKTKLAPRTIHNTYALVSALFRDAAVDGVIETTPCILRVTHLGAKVDADPYWRGGAHYTRPELVALASDPRVDLDHRVLWALMGIGGLRPGEAFGLRVRSVSWDGDPLGTMMIVTSHKKGRTKTNIARPVPIHPALAFMLRDWLDHGWARLIGRAPTPDDLVIPLPKSSKGEAGRMRTNSRTLKVLHEDLDLLGFRRRRVQDLRHTMISLSRSDGANKDILRRVTHQPPKEVIDGYTHFEWPVVCAEVLKLKLPLPTKSTAPSVVADEQLGPEVLATALATVVAQTQRSPGNLSASGASFLRGVGDLNP